jgi:DNA-binding transcriptional LysR family regulator
VTEYRKKLNILGIIVQIKRTMPQINLDMDVLRTLITAQQLGGFNRAAKRVGRSQSAVSQQIRKLEEQFGEPLFRKAGRGLALTAAGEIVLGYAQRILDLNDEAVAAVRGVAAQGWVRFGLPGDFAETWLPMALGRFKRTHPAVRVEASVDRNTTLIDRLDKGELDLALIFGRGARSDAELLAKLPVFWIGARTGKALSAPEEGLPLAVFESPCSFRGAAITALDRVGIPWHIAFTSPSLPGLWAAVEAGLGVTVRTATGLPGSLAVLNEESGLPPLPPVELCLHHAGRLLAPAVVQLKEILLDVLAPNLAALKLASASVSPAHYVRSKLRRI